MREIRKLISRWHRDELGAERKAARWKCSKAFAPILDIIRKYAVHASLKGWTLHGNAPHDAAPSVSHLEASRAVLALAAAAAPRVTLTVTLIFRDRAVKPDFVRNILISLVPVAGVEPATY